MVTSDMNCKKKIGSTDTWKEHVLTAGGAGDRAQMAATAASREREGNATATAAASSSGETYRASSTLAVSLTCSSHTGHH